MGNLVVCNQTTRFFLRPEPKLPIFGTQLPDVCCLLPPPLSPQFFKKIPFALTSSLFTAIKDQTQINNHPFQTIKSSLT